MSLPKRFMNLPEYSRKLQTLLFKHLSIKTFTLSLTLVTSLVVAPSRVMAEEKQPVDSQQKSTLDSNTEELLASTEQMIEQLIRQIDLENESAPEKGKLTGNPNPTTFISSVPNIRPVGGAITSNFGMRVHPIYHVALFHSGVDFAVPEGTRVHSTGDGIIAFSGYDKGFGQKVTINHGYGFKTIYAHLSKALVRQGQQVKRGDIIALSGNTGLSTGAHIHYEVHKDNVVVNPTAYFFDGKNPVKFITIHKTSPEEKGNNS